MASILLHRNIVGFSSVSYSLNSSKTDTKVSAHQAKLFFNCSWGLFVLSYSGLKTTRTRNVCSACHSSCHNSTMASGNVCETLRSKMQQNKCTVFCS